MSDTIGNTTATTGSVRVNGMASSTINTGLDEDWFRVTTQLIAVRDAVFARIGTVAEAEGLSINLPDTIQPSYTPANYAFLNNVAWDDFLAVI
jgi:hypothetical protein